MRKTLKFDENCINSTNNIKQIVRIMQQENAQLTIVPAMEDCAIALENIINDKLQYIDKILQIFSDCIEQLLDTYKQTAIEELDQAIQIIKTSKNPHKITAQGQIITSKIITLYAKECGLNAEILQAKKIIFLDQNNTPQAEQIMLRDDVYYITQGAICRDIHGNITKLPEGGDNYSATLLAAAINAKELQIWSNKNMMHTGDPNIVESTRAVEQMSFAQAAELAQFNNSIIHPKILLPCCRDGVDVVFKNIGKPLENGTKLTGEDNPQNFLVAAAKDFITLIRITSDKMLMTYEYHRKITEIFEKYQTSVGLITTTGFAMALTVEKLDYVAEIAHELELLGRVDVEPQHSIVCIIGNMEYKDGGIAAVMFETLNRTPIKMISYGASNRSISLLVESQHKSQMLQNINQLFR